MTSRLASCIAGVITEIENLLIQTDEQANHQTDFKLTKKHSNDRLIEQFEKITVYDVL